MADNDSVDFTPPNQHNNQVDDKDVLHINVSEHEPLNDPGCKHKNVVSDPTEELGDAFYCQDCKIGWIMAPVDSPT